MNRIKSIVKTAGVGVEATLKGIKGLIMGYKKSIRFEERDDAIVFMANGPSLKTTKLDGFSGKVEYACVNFFPGHDEKFEKLKPRYYCLFDPAFWDPKSAVQKEQVAHTYDALEKVNWKLTIVTCIDKKLPLTNPNINYQIVSPIQLVYEECSKLRHFLYRHNLVNPGAQNVATGALFYFINAGYKKIYLAGTDMSEFKFLFVDNNNNILLEKSHSYNEKQKYVNVIDIGLVKKGEFYVLLDKYCKMFKEFHLIAEYAREMNVSIINLNPESYVDVFTKSS